MLKDLTISQSIIVNANADKVWDVLTNPEIIKEYLFGTETVTDWKVGSAVIFQGEYGEQKYQDRGVVLENVKNERLSYSYWSSFSGLEDLPENFSTVTYSLVKKGEDQTEFTWTQKGYANEAGYKHSMEGMDAFLRQIKEIVER